VGLSLGQSLGIWGQWHTFWYFSDADTALGPDGAASLEPSSPKDSLDILARGCALLFLGGAVFFGAFLGGVFDKVDPPSMSSLSSPPDISSSESFFAFFFEALATAFVFKVVCVSFLAPALPPAAFEALAFGF
jgi:hypothetical protein